MIQDEEYIKAIKTKLQYEKEQLNKQSVIMSLPSNSELQTKASEVFKNNENMQQAYILGGDWMLNQCLMVFKGSGV